jgi:DNA-binding GntR family transcriptional regulator
VAVSPDFDPRPYMRVAAALRAQIRDGELRPGDKVPSLTILSRQYDYNRHTCAKALLLLQGEGLVTRIPGRGYFVSSDTDRSGAPASWRLG